MLYRVLFSVSGFLTLYCIIVALFLGNVNFNYILLAFSAVMAVFGFVDMKFSAIPFICTLKKIFIFGMIVVLAIFVVAEIFVISGATEKDRTKPDYTIILGAGLRGDKLSLTLKNRLDAFLVCNQGETVIVTGGQGFDETIPEAVAMEKYLRENGVRNIIIEDKSTNTKENLLNAKALIKEDLSEVNVKIISSDYHCYRAKMLAKRAGYKNVTTFGADTHPLLVLSFYIREGLALVKSFIFDFQEVI